MSRTITRHSGMSNSGSSEMRSRRYTAETSSAAAEDDDADQEEGEQLRADQHEQQRPGRDDGRVDQFEQRRDPPVQLRRERDRVGLLGVQQHQPEARYEHAQHNHFGIAGDHHQQRRDGQSGDRQHRAQAEQVGQQRAALGGRGERVLARADSAQSELGDARDDHHDRRGRDEATEIGDAQMTRHQRHDRPRQEDRCAIGDTPDRAAANHLRAGLRTIEDVRRRRSPSLRSPLPSPSAGVRYAAPPMTARARAQRNSASARPSGAARPSARSRRSATFGQVYSDERAPRGVAHALGRKSDRPGAASPASSASSSLGATTRPPSAPITSRGPPTLLPMLAMPPTRPRRRRCRRARPARASQSTSRDRTGASSASRSRAHLLGQHAVEGHAGLLQRRMPADHVERRMRAARSRSRANARSSSGPPLRSQSMPTNRKRGDRQSRSRGDRRMVCAEADDGDPLGLDAVVARQRVGGPATGCGACARRRVDLRPPPLPALTPAADMRLNTGWLSVAWRNVMSSSVTKRGLRRKLEGRADLNHAVGHAAAHAGARAGCVRRSVSGAPSASKRLRVGSGAGGEQALFQSTSAAKGPAASVSTPSSPRPPAMPAVTPDHVLGDRGSPTATTATRTAAVTAPAGRPGQCSSARRHRSSLPGARPGRLGGRIVRRRQIDVAAT